MYRIARESYGTHVQCMGKMRCCVALKSVCVYMFVYVCKCVCMCVFMYVCVCECVCLCVCVYVFMCLCVYVRACVHVCVCMCVHVYMCVCVCVCVCDCTRRWISDQMVTVWTDNYGKD